MDENNMIKDTQENKIFGGYDGYPTLNHNLIAQIWEPVGGVSVLQRCANSPNSGPTKPSGHRVSGTHYHNIEPPSPPSFFALVYVHYCVCVCITICEVVVVCVISRRRCRRRRRLRYQRPSLGKYFFTFGK
ncbi:hypothetical protein PGB90_005663 [Kerria lacca]